jgi:hypothetical protein
VPVEVEVWRVQRGRGVVVRRLHIGNQPSVRSMVQSMEKSVLPSLATADKGEEALHQLLCKSMGRQFSTQKACTSI